MTPQQLSMVLGNYLLIKVLVCKVLQNPTALVQGEMSSAIRQNAKVKVNFKLLGSMIYYTVMEYMEQMLKSSGFSHDLIHKSGLGNVIYE